MMPLRLVIERLHERADARTEAELVQFVGRFVRARKKDPQRLERCLSDRTGARKAKVEGSEGLEPKEFEEQVSECEAEVKQERASLAEDEKEEKAAREAWEAKKTALAKKTFAARASPYVESL